MNNLFYTNESIILYQSLKRYFKYILKKDLNIISANEDCPLSYCYFIIYEDESLSDDNIYRIVSTIPNQLIVIGIKDIEDISYVNLLDFSNLKEKINKALIDDSCNIHSAININAVRKKVECFFTGHGEDSLLKGIFDSTYSLSNGFNQYEMDQCSWKEFKEVYLHFFMESWTIFNTRFHKYKHYLTFVGFADEKKEIGRLIHKLLPFVEKIKKCDQKEINELKNTESNRAISFLQNIQEILLDIGNTLGLVE